MISRTDIQKVSDLPIEQVAEALGLTVRKHWSLCPFHSDTKPSLYFRVGKNKYRCFVCDHFGGPIDLAMEILSLNFHDAVCWLAQTFGILIDDENKRTFQNVKPREVKPVRENSLTPHPSPLTPEHLAQMVAEPVLTAEAKAFLFDERKLDPRVISWCGISSTHTHLLIPYFDIDGKFVSVQWRSLTSHPSPITSHPSPRFLFPKGSQCHIYNLQILRMLKKGEPLYITEGCSDCWAMLSAGYKAIAIPSATLLKPKDLEPLIRLSSSLSLSLNIFPDNDTPGERLFIQLKELLEIPSSLTSHPSPLIRHQLPSGCKDYSEYYVKSRERVIPSPLTPNP